MLKSRQELLDNFDDVFDPYLTRVILETKYEDLWANWQGVFIGGRGVIIFGHVFHGRLMDYDAEQDEAKRRRYWKMGIQLINGGEAAREELFLSHTPHDVRLFDLERGVYETEQYLFRFIAPEGVTACVLSPPGIPAFGPVYIPQDRATPCTSLKDETSVVWVAADFSKKERASFRTNASYFCRPQPDRSGPSAIVSARLSNSDIRLGGRLPVAICRFEYGDGKVRQIAMARRQVPGWEDFQINYSVSADLQTGSRANADELQRSALRSFQLLPDPVPRRTQK